MATNNNPQYRLCLHTAFRINNFHKKYPVAWVLTGYPVKYMLLARTCVRVANRKFWVRRALCKQCAWAIGYLELFFFLMFQFLGLKYFLYRWTNSLPVNIAPSQKTTSLAISTDVARPVLARLVSGKNGIIIRLNQSKQAITIKPTPSLNIKLFVFLLTLSVVMSKYYFTSNDAVE